jgi:hypothetical protein
MEEDNRENNYVSRTEIVQCKVQMPIPPSPGFTSPFKSIQEWLIYLCDNNQVEKRISEFLFMLCNSPNDNLLGIVGYNHTIEDGVPASLIVFQPASHRFYALPKERYGNFSLHELRDKVVHELKEFTRNSRFKDSFLTKAYYISTNFTGEIWPNPEDLYS